MARVTKIIKRPEDEENKEAKYVINVKQFAKFVVDLADTVAPTDIEEGMRVGCDFVAAYNLSLSFFFNPFCIYGFFIFFSFFFNVNFVPEEVLHLIF